MFQIGCSWLSNDQYTGRGRNQNFAIETHKTLALLARQKMLSKAEVKCPTLLIQYIVNFGPVKQEQRSRGREL